MKPVLLPCLGTKGTLHTLPTLHNNEPVPQVLKQVVNLSCYLWNTGLVTEFSKTVLRFLGFPPYPPLKNILKFFAKLVLPRKQSFNFTLCFPLKILLKRWFWTFIWTFILRVRKIYVFFPPKILSRFFPPKFLSLNFFLIFCQSFFISVCLSVY